MALPGLRVPKNGEKRASTVPVRQKANDKRSEGSYEMKRKGKYLTFRVGPSKVHGNGLFAIKNIPKDAPVLALTKKEHDAAGCWCNHDDPKHPANLTFVEAKYWAAKREIKADEELIQASLEMWQSVRDRVGEGSLYIEINGDRVQLRKDIVKMGLKLGRKRDGTKVQLLVDEKLTRKN